MQKFTEHKLTLQNCEKMNISGVIDVESFDDKTVSLITELGILTIKGDSLKVKGFAVETGDMMLEGKVQALGYSEGHTKKNLLSRIMK